MGMCPHPSVPLGTPEVGTEIVVFNPKQLLL